MAVIGVDYSEFGNELNYKSVYLHTKDGGVKLFESGDFVKDWYDMRKYIIFEVTTEEFFSSSSTVDHFIFDGAKYDSAYLVIVDDIGVLKYVNHNDPDEWYIDSIGIEYFVPEGTRPTWQEFKAMCK